jgi:hypothetical protein
VIGGVVAAKSIMERAQRPPVCRNGSNTLSTAPRTVENAISLTPQQIGHIRLKGPSVMPDALWLLAI